MSYPSFSGTDIHVSPKLIIFDFDGTLAETEAMFAQIISKKLVSLGAALKPNEISIALSGVTRENVKSHLEKLTGKNLQECFMSEVRAELRVAISAGLPATPGALEMLQRPSTPFCVASNASRFELIRRMRAANLFELVGPRFFSSDDVRARKPDPAVFLVAAEAMGVEPRDCLVIEDSVVGLEAARQAKMRYCAFVGSAHHSAQLRDQLRSYAPEALFLDLTELGKFLDGNYNIS